MDMSLQVSVGHLSTRYIRSELPSMTISCSSVSIYTHCLRVNQSVYKCFLIYSSSFLHFSALALTARETYCFRYDDSLPYFMR